VLITGGKGYLASFLSDALRSKGANVFLTDIVDHNQVNYFQADLTDIGAVKAMVQKINPDYIFHLGALIDRSRDFDQYDKIMQVNATGTVNLLQALKTVPFLNFVFASTSEVYGDIKAPFKESSIPVPASPYSLSKLAAENAIVSFSAINNMPFSIARLFNFFGPGMSKNFFIPEMLASFQSDLPFKMTGGKQLRDFLYVDDVVDALLKIGDGERTVGKVLNVCSGKAVTMRDLAMTAKEVTRSSSEIEFGALPYRQNEVWEMHGDPSLIKELTGFEPKYDLSEALKMLIEEKVE